MLDYKFVPRCQSCLAVIFLNVKWVSFSLDLVKHRYLRWWLKQRTRVFLTSYSWTRALVTILRRFLNIIFLFSRYLLTYEFNYIFSFRNCLYMYSCASIIINVFYCIYVHAFKNLGQCYFNPSNKWNYSGRSHSKKCHGNCS